MLKWRLLNSPNGQSGIVLPFLARDRSEARAKIAQITGRPVVPGISLVVEGSQKYPAPVASGWVRMVKEIMGEGCSFDVAAKLAHRIIEEATKLIDSTFKFVGSQELPCPE